MGLIEVWQMSVWDWPFDFQRAKAEGFEGDESEALEELGYFFRRTGRLSEARLAFTEACSKDPENSRYWYYLGDCLLRLGLPREAARALERSAALDPDHWVTQLKLGRALMGSGRPSKAVRAFTVSHKRNPRSPTPLIERARARLELGRWEDAAFDLKEALEMDPKAKRVRELLKSILRSRDIPLPGWLLSSDASA